LKRGFRNSWRGVVVAAVAAFALLPATAAADTVKVTVMDDSSANDGECSVREAVQATNDDLPVHGSDDCDHSGSHAPDTIRLKTGTAPISGTANENANATGDLDVEAGNGLTIVGKGSGSTLLDGDVDRVIDQLSGPVTLRNLTVQDGDAGVGQGGNVLDEADDTLTLEGARIRDGEADLGGGVRVQPGGALNMTESVVTNNVADGDQGGGGIHAGAPVVITNSTISNNDATGSFGPGGMRIEGGPSTIVNSTIHGNTTANGRGGAIDVTSGMSPRNLTISKSSIFDNHADGYRGGGIFYNGEGKLKISRSSVTENSAKSGGGGVEASDTADALKVSKSIISLNTLTSTSAEIIGGAAISTDGPSTITQTILAANDTFAPGNMAITYGGAIRNGGQMRITRSTLSASDAAHGFGGAIYQDGVGTTLTVSNSTLDLNSASSSGGAIFNELGAVAKVYNSTFAENQAGSQGDALYSAGTGSLQVRGSIFTDGTDACSSTNLQSKGYNVDSATTCAGGGAHDLPSTDPAIKALAPHGGILVGPPGQRAELPVMALKRSSPAKNLIPKRKCKDDKGRLKTDEIGTKRPHRKKCDAGAFEA
jgi:hypothetical protein